MQKWMIHKEIEEFDTNENIFLCLNLNQESRISGNKLQKRCHFMLNFFFPLTIMKWVI